MTRRELDWFWAHYLRGPEDLRDPAAAPLHAPDLAGLPETTIVVPELDPLHDEGVAYAERLRGAGVPVRLLEVPGAAHGFWWMDAVMSQADELTAALVPVIRGT
jgi:acetyl esterase